MTDLLPVCIALHEDRLREAASQMYPALSTTYVLAIALSCCQGSLDCIQS